MPPSPSVVKQPAGGLWEKIVKGQYHTEHEGSRCDPQIPTQSKKDRVRGLPGCERRDEGLRAGYILFASVIILPEITFYFGKSRQHRPDFGAVQVCAQAFVENPRMAQRAAA